MFVVIAISYHGPGVYTLVTKFAFKNIELISRAFQNSVFSHIMEDFVLYYLGSAKHYALKVINSIAGNPFGATACIKLAIRYRLDILMIINMIEVSNLTPRSRIDSEFWKSLFERFLHESKIEKCLGRKSMLLNALCRVSYFYHPGVLPTEFSGVFAAIDERFITTRMIEMMACFLIYCAEPGDEESDKVTPIKTGCNQ